MIKKILASLVIFTLFLAPVGNVFDQNPSEVSAKSYKSGKRSFNTNSNSNTSFFKKDNDQQVNKQKSTVTKLSKGGLLKGLMVGGLAGLLFGSLLSNLGALGSILGFMINIVAIFALITIIRKVFKLLKNKRKDYQTWER